jgi:MraZ protein
MSSEQNPLPEFSGEFCHGLDPKNRITIPSRWRRTEAEEFFLMPDRTNKFLRAMPPGPFRAVADKIAADPGVSAAERAVFMRHFYSRSQHASTDKQGRLLLPDELCTKLNLHGEVILVGVHEGFEVWNKETWKSTQESEASIFERIAGIAGL